MIREDDVIDRLRRTATAPAARGLLDDVAVLGDLVLTHDIIAEGVHFRSLDPASSVGWKLVAVNLSDLAAKGATPAGALLSLTLNGNGSWENDFLTGVEHACESYDLPLIGGDTIALPEGAPRVLGMTAIGYKGPHVPGRADAKAGDSLWLVGTLGDAAAGLELLKIDTHSVGPLIDVYRRPVPLLSAGQSLAPLARAMMDVSDGLLLDCFRMAKASNCAIQIALDALPLSGAFVAERGAGFEARLFAATGGDDYALLVSLPPEFDPETLSLPQGTRLSRIGNIFDGQSELTLSWRGTPVELPERLGFEHSSDQGQRAPTAPVDYRP